MSNKSQRYWLEFASRACSNTSVESKHCAFFNGLKKLPEPWGLGERAIPPIPKFNGSTVAICNLTKFLDVSKADVMYEFRRDFPDDSQYDDRLVVILRTSKVDLKHLIFTVIPWYIKSFEAYRVEYFDDVFAAMPAVPKPGRNNKRFYASEIWPINFFDDILCRRAFDLSADEAVDRCRGKIEHAAKID